jgi:hypothetical protein
MVAVWWLQEINMACECSTWDHYFGAGVMLYQFTCRLYGHAKKAGEQQALREAFGELQQLRNRWRNQR